uniref:Melanocortin 2 receptor accessory protein 2b n=1 Tax=Gasterosteus aculeatus TaxID=69293 RepID=G3P4K1_GASAC
MSDFHNRSQSSARRSDYVWQYEYYDEEEPVSFEGLKAHRYSIVIGFWVGLAVFVIFMFFVLTLLTKTGAPHQENQDSGEKRHRPGSCLVDIGSPQDENDKAFSRPLLTGPRSYFHFYINEEDQGHGKRTGNPDGARAQQGTRGTGSSGTDEMEDDVEEEAGGNQPLEGLLEFNIPNFVNLEHSSTFGEEDLLYEPSVVAERRRHSRDAHCDGH